MELNDAFGRRWRMLLVAAPIIAAVVAGLGYVASTADEYEARAVLSLSRFDEASSPADLRALVDGLDNSTGRDEVEDVVRSIDPASSGRIQVDDLGDGGDVRVSLVSEDGEAVAAALDAGVREALVTLAEIDRARTQLRLESALAAADERSALMREIEVAVGVSNLEDEVARRSADLLQLRNQIATSDQVSTQVVLEATLEEKSAELDRIQAELPTWQLHRAGFQRAVDAQADASLVLAEIDAAQEIYRSGDLLVSTAVVETSSSSDVLRAMVAGAVLAAAVVVAVAIISTSRRARAPLGPGRRDEESGAEASTVMVATDDGSSDDLSDVEATATGPTNGEPSAAEPPSAVAGDAEPSDDGGPSSARSDAGKQGRPPPKRRQPADKARRDDERRGGASKRTGARRSTGTNAGRSKQAGTATADRARGGPGADADPELDRDETSDAGGPRRRRSDGGRSGT